MQNAFVTGLFYYPIKSCAGHSVSRVAVGQRGIDADRTWVVVDQNLKCLTQRDDARMTLIQPSVSPDNGLSITAPGMGELKLKGNEAGNPLTVNVWDNQCESIDEGDDAAGWFSEYLSRPCRLVRVAENNTRITKVTRPDGDPVKLTFVDGSPFLVISQESLDDLNSRLAVPVPMDRFRPSIVIAGLGAFSEDEKAGLVIGSMRFFRHKPCSRCVMTVIDQATGAKGVEPLRTLSSYRSKENKVLFGTYFLHEQPGVLNVGDVVEVL